MSNQPTPPTFRVLVFELWDNGKIISPIYGSIRPEDTITTQELTNVRDYIELMIANPQNFHIVRPEPVPEFLVMGVQICSKCKFTIKADTEKANGICFNCEKKGILDATDKLSERVVKAMVEAEDYAILNEPIGEITKEQRKILDRINTAEPEKICNYCKLSINPETSPKDYKLGVHNRCLKSYAAKR